MNEQQKPEQKQFSIYGLDEFPAIELPTQYMKISRFAIEQAQINISLRKKIEEQVIKINELSKKNEAIEIKE